MDKKIQELTPTTSVGLADLFVLEQSGAAKSLSGQYLVNNLATYLHGHGGISDITYTAPVSPSLSGTMTIVMADTTQYTLSVTNGRGITNISWVDSGTPGDGQTHTGTISYNDGTSSTVTFKDGVRGNQGNQTYVWFKWSQDYPTQDADMLNSAAPYIGIYSGTASSAPSTYTSYTWYEYKGATGNTGASIQSIAKTSTSGLVDTYTVTLTDGNTSNFTVTNARSIVSLTMQGNHAAGTFDQYTFTYNDGSTDTFAVYNGANGLGSVSSVSGIQADGNGDVPQVIFQSTAPTTATVGQEKQLLLDTSTGTLYCCTGASGGTYTWAGTGVTVDSAFSTSSTNPLQNKVITNKVGTAALNTTAQDLCGAVNELLTDIPSASSTTPSADGTGAAGTGTTWARSNHVHPLNVPTSGVPADLGTASNGSATTYARSDHVHSNKTLDAASPADNSTVADCLVYAQSNPKKVFVWAKYAATSYTPGGADGIWVYTLYTTYTLDQYYTIFEASNTGTGELYRAKSDGTWAKVAPDAATATPANLGTAAVGSSSDYARADHVHKMPSASDVGAMSKWTLLWTNASPSSSFAAQTVQLNLSGYDMVGVFGYNDVNDGGIMAFAPVGGSGALFFMYNYRQRRAFAVSSAGVQFGSGYSGALNNSLVVSNGAAIPYYIYGIKGIS